MQSLGKNNPGRLDVAPCPESVGHSCLAVRWCSRRLGTEKGGSLDVMGRTANCAVLKGNGACHRQSAELAEVYEQIKN